ncbi:MAG: isochorismate synthase [Acidimicrobiales bacterium]
MKTALRARTVPLADPPDLLTVAGAHGWLFERERAGLAAYGRCLELCAGDDVTAALAAIETEDAVGLPGCGPIAIGALPFAGTASANLTVPEVVVGRTLDGRGWLTTIGSSAADLDDLVALPAQDPDGFSLTSPIPHRSWMDLVTLAVESIEAGHMDKVVLAREIQVDANRDIHVPTVLRRLRSLYPACTVLSMPLEDGGQFVAASPELLIARAGDRVESHPLAGTIPRSGDPLTDQALADGLLASPKDRAEHDWVVRDVEGRLRPWCSSLDVPDTPSIVSFRNVSHLGTHLTGRLAASAPSAFTLALELHPTAAVGGTPRGAALAWLTAHEQLDRGPYAGPTGWVDARGDGQWVVGIRSAVIRDARARLFAGVGVVDGSDPAAELAETQFKLQALLAAVVRP